MAIHDRDTIDIQYTWDLSDLYANDKEFENALSDLSDLPSQYLSFKDSALLNADNLLAYLKFDDASSIKLSHLANYAERKHDEDTRVSRYQEYSDKVNTLIVETQKAASWFTPTLLMLDPHQLEQMFTEQPDLAVYKRKLEKILRLAPHVLPEQEESLLASAGEVAAQPETIYSMFNDADLVFPDAQDEQGFSHKITHGSFIPLLMSPDRTLRQSAYTSLYRTYLSFKNTSAAMLANQAKVLKFFAQSRHYETKPGIPSSLEASLFPTEVPTQVYLNLIDAVRRNIEPLHRYIALRKHAMGYQDLHFWDIYAPLVPSIDMKFTYQQACDIILQALEPMGDEYISIVKDGLSQRWIDVYENPGKRSGAYSAGGYGMHPVILLNFQGTLDDVFTLIHEMGHSVHTYLACATQPPAYADYEMFVAEVASTCNEALLMHWFIEHASDNNQRAYLLNHYLEQFRTTLYRQCMFAEFERDYNEMVQTGSGLTAEALCTRYGQLNRDYYGPDIVVDDEISVEWARIPHFYYDYYVYVYATSFAAATALSQQILQQGSPAVERYLNFLRSGSSKPPLELLKGAGVDMSTPKPIDDALMLFGELVDQMNKLILH